MESEFDLEQVREVVTLIQHAVEEVDSLTKNTIEARWKYEMVSRDPKLGISRDPRNGQPITFEAKDFYQNIEALSAERDTAIESLKALTGAPTVDAARMSYLRLVTAYQRVGSIRELTTLVEANYPKAREEAAAQDLISADERYAAVTDAIDHLKQVFSSITVPAVEAPSTISLFRQ
jgi:hypothetical protein